jgi:2-aminophenol/2-amino-5-chlorophenol 1,6-dioxygenase subunit beta
MKNTKRTAPVLVGALAPHPPHLVYAENPPQNEPKAECGWEELRWGYERLRESLSRFEFDVILVHTPHWRTSRGHHVLSGTHFKGLSVDPIFPHLFRYHYDFQGDPHLANTLVEKARALGLTSLANTNPDFRVDYGTLVSCHMARPTWDLPVVSISSCSVSDDFSPEVGEAQMRALGEATRMALQETGQNALLLASCSLSHRHFTRELAVPEDMTHEHIYNYNQYLWDMRMLSHMRAGNLDKLREESTEFMEQAVSETRAGSLTWLLAALGFPNSPARVHAYGTVIGTGNAIVEFPAVSLACAPSSSSMQRVFP